VIEEHHVRVEQEKLSKGHDVIAGSLFPVDHNQPEDAHQDTQEVNWR
jgi:hypothetical protein